MTEEHKEHIVCHQSHLDFSNLAEGYSPSSEKHSLLTEEHKDISLVIEAIFTFNFSINWGVFVIFVLPTKDKHSYYIRSTVQINSLPYKLMKTNLLANKLTHQLINLQTHQLKSLSTHQLINLQTYQLINLSTQKPINSKTYQLINLQTHQLKNLSTHQLKNSSTYKLTNSSTYKLKNSST